MRKTQKIKVPNIGRYTFKKKKGRIQKLIDKMKDKVRRRKLYIDTTIRYPKGTRPYY